jgi:hypothetical protein
MDEETINQRSRLEIEFWRDVDEGRDAGFAAYKEFTQRCDEIDANPKLLDTASAKLRHRYKVLWPTLKEFRALSIVRMEIEERMERVKRGEDSPSADEVELMIGELHIANSEWTRLREDLDRIGRELDRKQPDVEPVVPRSYVDAFQKYMNAPPRGRTSNSILPPDKHWGKVDK